MTWFTCKYTYSNYVTIQNEKKKDRLILNNLSWHLNEILPGCPYYRHNNINTSGINSTNRINGGGAHAVLFKYFCRLYHWSGYSRLSGHNESMDFPYLCAYRNCRNGLAINTDACMPHTFVCCVCVCVYGYIWYVLYVMCVVSFNKHHAMLYQKTVLLHDRFWLNLCTKSNWIIWHAKYGDWTFIISFEHSN